MSDSADSVFQTYVALLMGSVYLVGGLLSAVTYPRPGDLVLSSVLVVGGMVLVVGGCLSLPMEDRMQVRNLLAKLGIGDGCVGCCVECRYYGYERAVRESTGHGGLRQEVRHNFSRGFCLRQGLLIVTACRPRDCFYFKRAKHRVRLG